MDEHCSLLGGILKQLLVNAQSDIVVVMKELKESLEVRTDRRADRVRPAWPPKITL
jgi:hypothetical protein